MVAWITIQTPDLYDYMAATQVNAIKSVELASWQTNPIDEIIDDVTARIRAEISGNKNNRLSADKTKIPHDLKSVACYLVLESAQVRIPTLKLTEDQVRLANESREYLKRIAQGEVPVSCPDDAQKAADFPKNIGCDVVNYREKVATRESLQGF